MPRWCGFNFFGLEAGEVADDRVLPVLGLFVAQHDVDTALHVLLAAHFADAAELGIMLLCARLRHRDEEAKAWRRRDTEAQRHGGTEAQRQRAIDFYS